MNKKQTWHYTHTQTGAIWCNKVIESACYIIDTIPHLFQLSVPMNENETEPATDTTVSSYNMERSHDKWLSAITSQDEHWLVLLIGLTDGFWLDWCTGTEWIRHWSILWLTSLTFGGFAVARQSPGNQVWLQHEGLLLCSDSLKVKTVSVN